MMRALRFLALAIALPAGASAAHAASDRGLAVGNFVAAGDAIVDVLAPSGLAFTTMDLGSAAEPQMRALRASLRPTAPPGAGQSQQTACPRGGHVKTTLYDTDRDDTLSSGDRFVTVFESCVTEGGVLTGRSEFRIVAHRFEGTSEVTELEFRFVELGTPELRWSGPARAVLRSDLLRGTDRYTIRYRDLAVRRGSQAMRWDFTLDMVRPTIGAPVVSADGAMTLDTMRLQLHQDEPYVLTMRGFPNSGLLTASDPQGARLQVEAGPRRYAYRLYRAGNRGEVPDSASRSKPYGQR